MLRYEHILRVRYAETDQMGVVYYGNYAMYFEVARAEMVRSLGFSYSEMERRHRTMMPVLELNVNYKKPARYDEDLRIVTEVRSFPTIRMTFDHEVYNPQNELLTTGYVTLVFVDTETMRPRRPPQALLQILQHHWSPG